MYKLSSCCCLFLVILVTMCVISFCIKYNITLYLSWLQQINEEFHCYRNKGREKQVILNYISLFFVIYISHYDIFYISRLFSLYHFFFLSFKIFLPFQFILSFFLPVYLCNLKGYQLIDAPASSVCQDS